jgi:hypothetical protein
VLVVILVIVVVVVDIVVQEAIIGLLGLLLDERALHVFFHGRILVHAVRRNPCHFIAVITVVNSRSVRRRSRFLVVVALVNERWHVKTDILGGKWLDVGHARVQFLEQDLAHGVQHLELNHHARPLELVITGPKGTCNIARATHDGLAVLQANRKLDFVSKRTRVASGKKDGVWRTEFAEYSRELVEGRTP